jgi:hypothetical protein
MWTRHVGPACQPCLPPLLSHVTSSGTPRSPRRDRDGEQGGGRTRVRRPRRPTAEGKDEGEEAEVAGSRGGRTRRPAPTTQARTCWSVAAPRAREGPPATTSRAREIRERREREGWRRKIGLQAPHECHAYIVTQSVCHLDMFNESYGDLDLTMKQLANLRILYILGVSGSTCHSGAKFEDWYFFYN